MWDKITDMDNLIEAYNKAKKGKTWQRIVKFFDREKDKLLQELQQMLIDGTFHTSAYREKIIYEPKQRTIYVLPFYPDRIMQHAVMNIVAPIWDRMFIEDSYCCRKGKGQHAGSKRCMQFVRRNKFCLQGDISKFYPSINHEIMMDIIARKIKDNRVLKFFEDIINSIKGETNIPIGNYTSQWLGNLYMNELDQFIKHELHVRDYIRYCDDFLLFSNDKEQLRQWADAVEDFVNNRLKLKLSKKRLYPVSQGVDFLGYRHFPDGKILVRKSTAKRQKQIIKDIPYMLGHGIITKETALAKINSIRGWLQWANTHNFSMALMLDDLEKWVIGYDGKNRFGG